MSIGSLIRLDVTMKRPSGLLTSAVGFALGITLASAYLLLGGNYFLFIPRWAVILFYPCFLVGNAAYRWGLSQEASKVVGVLVVGFACAALVVLARFAWFALELRRQSAAMTPDPE